MKIIKTNRNFIVGINKRIKINHGANIYLNNDEQITFIFKNKQEYDVVKKNWGYYATPSINYRLKINSFKGYNMMNIGSGKGFTVLEIIKQFEKILKKKIRYKFVNRRTGDVPKIFTSFELVKKKLLWSPQKSLRSMCESSYKSSRKN